MQRQSEARGTGAFVPTAKWINGVATFINDFRVTGAGGIQCSQDGSKVRVSFVGDLGNAKCDFYTTTSDEENPYPAIEHGPNRYYCVKAGGFSVPESVGQGAVLGDDTDTFHYVYNYGPGYIPEGQSIPVWTAGEDGHITFWPASTFSATLTEDLVDNFPGSAQIVGYDNPTVQFLNADNQLRLPKGTKVRLLETGSGGYELIDVLSSLTKIATLNSDIAPGGSGFATILKWNGTAWVTDAAFDQVTVSDAKSIGALSGKRATIRFEIGEAGLWVLEHPVCG